MPLKLSGMETGIDVSYWQGEIKFHEMETYPGFMFIRALFGAAYSWSGGDYDKQFDRNWLVSKEFGIPRGGYHFLLSYQSPELQAQLFVDRMTRHGDIGELPPVCDVEYWQSRYYPDRYSAPSLSGINRFSNEVMRLTGLEKIIIYGGGFLKGLTNLDKAIELKKHDFWLAQYNSYSNIEVPLPWDTWTFWQHSDKGTGTPYGIRGNVDMNYYNGTKEQFSEYLRGGVVTPVPPQPPEPPAPLSGNLIVTGGHVWMRKSPTYWDDSEKAYAAPRGTELELTGEEYYEESSDIIWVKVRIPHDELWITSSPKWVEIK